MSKSALIIVDLQNDFCPGGALAVPEGDQIITAVNDLIRKFAQNHLPVFATRDWHPENHISFKARGGPWPSHCLQNTHGAEFHPKLKLPASAVIISKASNPDKDAYSGFDGTDLARRLKDLNMSHVVMCGLTTDYCVRATALDAVKHGFSVTVVEDAVRGVNLKPKDAEKALAEMKEAGARLVRHQEVGV